MIVDTHAHLTDTRLAADLPAVLERAAAAGVAWLVTIASDLPDSERTAALAGQLGRVYASVGIHPHAASSATDPALARVRDLTASAGVVALGETGLDYHYDNSPKETQQLVFRKHLEMAAELDLPVVVHSREADDDVIAILRQVGWHRGILHCFTGGARLLEEALRLGWCISFSGMITFPKWAGADLLRAVPRDRLLVETDSPYLAPVPYRGKRNEPAYVAIVAEHAARIRGEDPDELKQGTTANARRLYRVDPSAGPNRIGVTNRA